MSCCNGWVICPSYCLINTSLSISKITRAILVANYTPQPMKTCGDKCYYCRIRLLHHVSFSRNNFGSWNRTRSFHMKILMKLIWRSDSLVEYGTCIRRTCLKRSETDIKCETERSLSYHVVSLNCRLLAEMTSDPPSPLLLIIVYIKYYSITNYASEAVAVGNKADID